MRIHNSKWQTNLRQTYYLSTATATRCTERGIEAPPKQATVDVRGAATLDKNNPGQSCWWSSSAATWALATLAYTFTHTQLYTCTHTASQHVRTRTMQLQGAGRQLLWGRDAPTATCYKKWQKITLACRCFVILTPATPSTATSHSPTIPIPVSVPLSVPPTPSLAPAPSSFCNSLYALFTLERIVAHLPRHKWEFWAVASDRHGTVVEWGSWWWV